MTPEQWIAHLEAVIAWHGVRDLWRARIGRLPRAHEPRLQRLTDRHGVNRLSRAIIATAVTGQRRTADRWAFFLGLFGEAP